MTEGAIVENQPERVEAFTQEIESLKLKASSAENENRLLILGALSLIGGLALSIIGAVQVTGTSVPADQRAFMATGTFLGIALIIVGAALFVRFSLARYMRFWLIRLIHESRANTDRIVEAIEGYKRRQ